MKRIILLAMVVHGLAVVPCYAGDGSKPTPCQGADEVIECLIQHNRELFMANPEHYWKIWGEAEHNARTCASLKDVQRFLEVGPSISRHVAPREEFRSFVQEVAIANPACLFDGLLVCSEATMKLVLTDFLGEPFFVDGEKLRAVTKEQLSKEKYRTLRDILQKSKAGGKQ